MLLGAEDEAVPLEERRAGQSPEEATTNPACCPAKSAASHAPLGHDLSPAGAAHFWPVAITSGAVASTSIESRKVQCVLFYAESK